MIKGNPSLSEECHSMASSGKAAVTRRGHRAPTTEALRHPAESGASELEMKPLDEGVDHFIAATAKVLRTADEALRAAQEGNKRIAELNSRIAAKLDELDGRKPEW
jgi:hypothetical protein